jgi:hypothetical protein
VDGRREGEVEPGYVHSCLVSVHQRHLSVCDEDVASTHVAVNSALRAGKDGLPRPTDGPDRFRRHRVQADVPATISEEQLPG